MSVGVVAVLCAAVLNPLYGGQHDFRFKQADLRLLTDSYALDKQLAEKGCVYADPKLSEYVRAILERLRKAQPAPDRVEFSVQVLREPAFLAFSLPQGSIYVSMGMLADLENEAQLAAVLGREIAHITARHQYLQSRKSRGYANAVSFADYVIHGVTALPWGSDVDVWFLGGGYKDEWERQADREGLPLMTAAGYDPRAAIRVLELIDKSFETEIVRVTRSRRERLARRISKVRELAASAPSGDRGVSGSEYLSRVAGAISASIAADLESRRARSAFMRAQRLVNWEPAAPRYRALLADAYRELGAKTPEPSQAELRSNRKEERRRLTKCTPEEEQAALLAAPGGTEARRANEAAAEKLYLEAIAAEPSLAAARRGLGMLYQRQSKFGDSIREYRLYLDSAAPDAADRARIERRLSEIRAQSGQPD